MDVTVAARHRGGPGGTDVDALRVALAAEQLRRPVPGGVGTYTRGLLLGLARCQAAPPVEVALVVSRAPRRAAAQGEARVDPLERLGPVQASSLPGWALTRSWDRGWCGVRGSWDLVHATSLAAPPTRRDPRSGRRPPLVVTVHDLAWRRHPEATTGRGRRWHEAALRRALRRARAFVVPSAPVAADLVAAGAEPGDVHVVPEAADHLPAPDGPGASALLRRHGVEGPYLLTVATLEPRKNLRRLLAAYATARPSLPEPWPLVVVGPRGWGDAGVAPAPGVVAVGAVAGEVLAALYDGARAFAYVPLTEGFGLPPLEAMTFGVPVVASTGVPSVAAPPGSPAPALLVPPNDVDAIADALVRASADARTRATLAAAGAELVVSRTWRETAESHVALWRSLS